MAFTLFTCIEPGLLLSIIRRSIIATFELQVKIHLLELSQKRQSQRNLRLHLKDRK